jgi:hypothetical protein
VKDHERGAHACAAVQAEGAVRKQIMIVYTVFSRHRAGRRAMGYMLATGRLAVRQVSPGSPRSTLRATERYRSGLDSAGDDGRNGTSLGRSSGGSSGTSLAGSGGWVGVFRGLSAPSRIRVKPNLPMLKW